MLSMSSELMSALAAPNACDWMTPSTTTRGAFPLLMLVGDRRMMFVPLPGCPIGTTVTPAILPWMDSSALVAGTASAVCSTLPTVNGTRVPDVGSTRPVVTMACSVSATSRIVRFTVTAPLAGTVTPRTTAGW